MKKKFRKENKYIEKLLINYQKKLMKIMEN